MTNQREAFEKWCIDSAEKLGKSNLTVDEGRIAWFAWRDAQADQSAIIAQLQLDNAKMREAFQDIDIQITKINNGRWLSEQLPFINRIQAIKMKALSTQPTLAEHNKGETK